MVTPVIYLYLERLQAVLRRRPAQELAPRQVYTTGD